MSEETKKTAAFIFREILILLSPFIPFITEEIWLKNSLDNSGKDHLMLSNWVSGKPNKEKSNSEVVSLIQFISSIRSFKNDLNISPG